MRYDYDSAGALEGRRWLLADERGSIYAHADEAGAIIQINTYDEYGRPGNSNQGRFGYTGQIWLAEAGLYHYKARAYHAELGVFMQSDPIGQSGGVNLYAYVGGDPVNFTDPWGLSRITRCRVVRERVRTEEGKTTYFTTHQCEKSGWQSFNPVGGFGQFDEFMRRNFGSDAARVGESLSELELCNVAQGMRGRMPDAPEGASDDLVVGMMGGFDAVLGGGVRLSVGVWHQPSTGRWGVLGTGSLAGGADIDFANGALFLTRGVPTSGASMSAEFGFSAAEFGYSRAIDNGDIGPPIFSGGLGIGPDNFPLFLELYRLMQT